MLDMTFAENTATKVPSTALPHCGMAADTLVLTLRGAVAAGSIKAGDKVITRNGARAVVSVETIVAPEAAVMRISAGVLGKDRPEADMLVTPSQPILIRDWRAKAMDGVDQAVMTAARLADGQYIRAETHSGLRLVTLRFETEQVIYAAGLEFACEAAI